jgi:hypothetical protein
MFESSVCPICLEECKIPVELQCFSCFRHDGIHCHSLVRYCEQCCIRLFELDKDIGERKTYLKCLYCDASTDPRLYSTEYLPYRRDYYFIAKDCQEYKECPYCHSRNGIQTHQNLMNHVRSCQTAYKVCEECKTFYQCDNTHSCPSSHYTICTQCNKMIDTSLDLHMESECMYRSVTCPYCHTGVTALEITDHLLSHIESSKQRTLLLQDLLFKEDELRRRILQDCHFFYQSLYAEDPHHNVF